MGPKDQNEPIDLNNPNDVEQYHQRITDSQERLMKMQREHMQAQEEMEQRKRDADFQQRQRMSKLDLDTIQKKNEIDAASSDQRMTAQRELTGWAADLAVSKGVNVSLSDAGISITHPGNISFPEKLLETVQQKAGDLLDALISFLKK